MVSTAEPHTTAPPTPRDMQGQQGPHGIHQDAPVRWLPRRPSPSPRDHRRLLSAEQPAGRRPSPPPSPCPRPLAAPHPQPLLVDGGTLLWSVLQGQLGGGAGVGPVSRLGVGRGRGRGAGPGLLRSAGFGKPEGKEEPGQPAVPTACPVLPDRRALCRQASGTPPCTRTCLPASPPQCPAPCHRSSRCPRTPLHSWSSCPQSPRPTPPPTHLVRAPRPGCMHVGCEKWV